MRMRTWVTLLLLLALATPAAAAELTGSYRLVEQRYQSGSANMLGRTPPPVTLQIEAAGSVWLRSDDAPRQRFSWPSWVGDHGSWPLEEVTASLDPSAGTLQASYRVRPHADESFTVQVEERYALVEDGEALEGTMTVRFDRDGEDRGGFTLTRRFERE